LIEGSSATDSVTDVTDITDVTDVTDVRKKEEGRRRNSRFQVSPGNVFESCCASSFLIGGRASRNSFLGRAKERDMR